MAKSSTLTLFVQLVKHIPERIIADAVAKRQTDYRSKGVRHADALVSLLFHQLSGSTSLRDTVLGMEPVEIMATNNIADFRSSNDQRWPSKRAPKL